MEKIQSFQITGMTIAGFKSYEEPTNLVFGNPTVITGGNGRGKTSIADAIAFAVTGLPFFGERGIDRLHNEAQPDVSIGSARQAFSVDDFHARDVLVLLGPDGEAGVEILGPVLRQGQDGLHRVEDADLAGV